MIAGVDEAGRGPVLGPLVICAFACESNVQEKLREIGVRDSKELTPEKREKLAKQIEKLGEFNLVEISAEELTELMHKRISLNEIEAMKIGLALNHLEQKTGPLNEVFVDSPDSLPKKFEIRLRKYYTGKAKIVSENKADSKYAVVGAASILAKVLRDLRIEEIKKEFDEDFGSGYSHDERTIAFLKKHINGNAALQRHIRHKWKTAKNLKQTQLPLSDYF
jgi:ribonuclease HII